MAKPLSDLALSKNDYKDLLMDYANAPTGRAYVGFNKRPFMKSDTGIGFKGVLIQDENRALVQCYECGNWFARLTKTHFRICNPKIDGVRGYRIKHGLSLRQSLCSDAYALKMTENLFKNPTLQKGKHYNNLNFLPPSSNKGTQTEAYKNLRGTCALQVLSRLVRFILTSHELPGRENRGNALYKILVKRFGSYGDGLAAHGLPNLKRKGTTMLYTFPDGEELRFNLNQWNDREALYQMILKKCPVLTTKDLTKFLPKPPSPS